jgi:hypothetical protein
MTYRFSSDTWLDVILPLTSYHLGIDAASGIVAIFHDGVYQVYYDGNRFGSEPLADWDARVRHAAGRLMTGYPTIARLTLEPAE